MSAGLAGVGGSIGLEVGSFGAGTAVAVPVAAGSIALIADGAARIGTGVALFRNGNNGDFKQNKYIKDRKRPGRDKATSKHIIEKIDGETNSVTHQVMKDGKIIHQHQTHIGKYGNEMRFPDERIEYPIIE